jgi:hypothetical protein
LNAPAGIDLEFRLDVYEATSEVQSANLLWRLPGGEFRSLDMDAVPGGFTCALPASDIKPPHLEYVIQARLSDGSVVSYPQNDPLSSPQIIGVLAERRVEGPQFYVLYPQSGQNVFEVELRIAVSVFDPDLNYDPSSLEVFIDGKRVPVSQSSPSYLLVKFSGLRAGIHEAALRSADFAGHRNPEYTWKFHTSGRHDQLERGEFAWGFTGESGREDFNDEPHDYVRGDLRAEGRYGGWTVGARCYLTSDESTEHQPQNRFLLKIQQRHFTATLGDASPMFSDLVLSGKRVRGAEIGLHTGAFHLQGVYGEINRGIQGSTYRRFLGSIRPYFTTSWGWKLGFTFLKAKDDLGSVAEAYASPQDNVVAGADLLVPLWNHAVQWSISAALSLTALDIRGGSISDSLLNEAGVELPFDPRNWQNLLVINESLSPPNPLGMSSLAWTTTLNLNRFGQTLSLNYRSIGPAYRSFGNPYLQNDLAGWSVSDQFSALNHRLFVTLGFNHSRDNLKGTKSATTASAGGWISLSLMPSFGLPQITTTVNYNLGGNDLDKIDTLMTGGDTLYTDQRRDESSSSIAISATQELFLLGRRGTITFNLNNSSFRDRLEDRPPGYAALSSASRNYGIIWRSSLSQVLTGTLDYAYFSSDLGSSQRYHQISGAVNERMEQPRLNVILGVRRRIGEGNLARWQSDASGEWEFIPRHLLRLTLTHFFNDRIQNEGVYRLYYFKRF